MKWFFLCVFFFALSLTQIEFAFQKVFQEIRTKRKKMFAKRSTFFLVPAHRFWGFTPLPEKTNAKHYNPSIQTNISLLQALRKKPLKYFFKYKKNTSLLGRLQQFGQAPIVWAGSNCLGVAVPYRYFHKGRVSHIIIELLIDWDVCKEGK